MLLLVKSLILFPQDACAFYEDHEVIKEEAGAVAVSENAGLEVANALGNVKAIIHQNHGLISVSKHSIDSAAFWFSALERCCHQELMLLSTEENLI